MQNVCTCKLIKYKNNYKKKILTKINNIRKMVYASLLIVEKINN